MRVISIRDDIKQILLQLVCAVPEVFLDYDVNLIELQHAGEYYDEDRHATFTLWEIVFVESEDTELLIGEVVLLENFEAVVMIFED